MTHDEMIAVLIAQKDGKAIQCALREQVTNPLWIETRPGALLNFQVAIYRIKPEPMVIWVSVYPHHLGGVYLSKEAADAARGSDSTARKFIEVIE